MQKQKRTKKAPSAIGLAALESCVIKDFIRRYTLGRVWHMNYHITQMHMHRGVNVKIDERDSTHDLLNYVWSFNSLYIFHRVQSLCYFFSSFFFVTLLKRMRMGWLKSGGY